MNRRDVSLQISSRILHGIEFRYVERVDEVLAIALLAPAAPSAGAPAIASRGARAAARNCRPAGQGRRPRPPSPRPRAWQAVRAARLLAARLGNQWAR